MKTDDLVLLMPGLVLLFVQIIRYFYLKNKDKAELLNKKNIVKNNIFTNYMKFNG